MTKQLVKTAVFGLFLSLFVTSCSVLPGGDEEIKSNEELIVGLWRVNSFKLNGEEFIGEEGLIRSLTIDFGPIVGSRGTRVFRVIGSTGEESSDFGQYSINEINGELTFTGDGQPETYELSFQGDNELTMNSAAGGFITTFKAERLSN